MPDYTLCVNANCPMRMTCYRFIAAPSGYQSYSLFSPNDKGVCEMYMEVGE